MVQVRADPHAGIQAVTELNVARCLAGRGVSDFGISAASTHADVVSTVDRTVRVQAQTQQSVLGIEQGI